jgi:hyperosmotically inducible protein
LRLKLISGALALGFLAFGNSFVVSASQQNPPTAADNTKANTRDRSKTAPTADNAKDNTSDRDIMQKIRQSVMDDKTLSTYAHNVKIIAQNGKVTLKGPVRTEDEKKSIEQMATTVAGAGNVTNEITIKPAKKSS